MCMHLHQAEPRKGRWVLMSLQMSSRRRSRDAIANAPTAESPGVEADVARVQTDVDKVKSDPAWPKTIIDYLLTQILFRDNSVVFAIPPHLFLRGD